MGCFCGVYLSWIVNRAIQNHDHRVDLSIDPPCYDADDRNLGVDHLMDVNHGHHRNDLLDDLHDPSLDDDHHDALVDHHNCVLDVRRDPRTGVNLDVNRDLRTSDLLDDPLMGANRVNRNCVRRDLKMGAKTDVSRVNRNYARRDRSLGVMMDVNLYHRMNDRLDDLNSDDVRHDPRTGVSLDVSHGLRMSDLLDGRSLDVSRVNRRSGVHLNAQLVYEHRVDLTIDPECYVRRDRNLDVTMVVKNLHERYY
jgi:hypothetical protein